MGPVAVVVVVVILFRGEVGAKGGTAVEVVVLGVDALQSSLLATSVDQGMECYRQRLTVSMIYAYVPAPAESS